MIGPSSIVRFSLRWLMVVLTGFCVAIGWWTSRANAQRTAVAKIVQAGGEVDYAYYFEPIHNDSWVHHLEARSFVPRWMRLALGDDYFSSVIGVKVPYDSEHPINVDALMKQMAVFRRLRFLDLQNHELTDEGLLHIAHLAMLEKLDLQDAKISDDGMRSLARLNNLVELWLTGAPISDIGLANGRISDKKRLRILSLLSTSVSDDGLLTLVSLPNLWLLSVDLSHVTEDGRQRFRKSRPDIDL